MCIRDRNYWDIAAGIIILKEAGGFIDFFEEDTTAPLKKNILSTNSKPRGFTFFMFLSFIILNQNFNPASRAPVARDLIRP